MSFVARDSTKESRSWSLGPVKVQVMTWTAQPADTSGTVTADRLKRIDHIWVDGFFNHTAAPTFSGNQATLAMTLPAGAAASAVIQDLTYTADAAGADGNLITIEYTDGATAGAEVVTVTGTAISVQIEDGVSTATQIKTAVDGDTGAAALVNVTISGTGSNAQTITSPTPLTGGIGSAGTLWCIGI